MEDDEILDAGKTDMRGRINVSGIEKAAEAIGDAYGAPATTESLFLQGVILAAFEAGMSHQIARTR